MIGSVEYSQYWSSFLVWLTGGYLALIPSISILPSVGPYNEKRVLQIGVLIVGGGTLLISRKTRQQWLSVLRRVPSLAQFGLCVVVGLGVLSSALAPSPFYGFLEAGHFLLLFALAGIVASEVRREPEQTESLLLGAIALGALLYAVYFAVRYRGSLALPRLEIGRETVSGFANIRFFNQYQTWTLPLLVGAVLSVPKKWRVSRGVLFLLPSLWWTLVFASNVRGTVLALFVSAMALVRSGMELHTTHALQEGRSDLVVIEGKLKHCYVSG